VVKRVRIEPQKMQKVKRVPLEPQRKAANHKKLTEDNVARLPVRKAQYRVWDEGTDAARGLCVLVSPKGAKSYRSTYYFPGSSKPHNRTLGRVGEMTLVKARELCRQDRAQAKEGFNPKAPDPAKTANYKEAVEEYVRLEQKGRRGNSPSTTKETLRVLLKLSQPSYRGVKEEDQRPHKWLTRRVAGILPEEIQGELNLLRDGDGGLHKPRPYLSNSLYGRLCTFFAWCAKPAVRKVTTNPMIGMDKPWDGAKRRDRAWFKDAAGDEAIRSLWKAAEAMGATEGAYLKLLLLTGKRKTALAEMRWEEIDETWFWNAPKPVAKNKRLHPIPLSGLALRNLHPRKAAGFVFPGDDNGRIYVNGSWLQTKIINASGIEDYFHHGVRHLVETKLAKLKVLPHIRDLLLDHVPSRGSGAGYDHHDYEKELHEAMETWAAYVEALVKPQGVALLR
jgi:integrase